jgi:hypothetical protein
MVHLRRSALFTKNSKALYVFAKSHNFGDKHIKFDYCFVI